MLPAGIVAHSRPRNAQSVSVAVVVTPRANAAGLDSAITKCERSRRNNPPKPTRISGRTFNTVVTTCTWPALRTLRRFTTVSSQTVAMASSAADCRVPDERRHKRIEITDERNRQRRVRGPGRNPVAPRDQKTREIAKGRPRVGVRTTCGRIGCGEPREHERQQQGAASRDDPSDEADAAVGRKRRRQQEDARADHVAHDERDRRPEPERGRILVHTHSRNYVRISPWSRSFERNGAWSNTSVRRERFHRHTR